MSLNYEQIRVIYPDLSLDIIQRLGHDPVTNKPLVCDGKLGPKTLRAKFLPVDKIKTVEGQIALVELLAGSIEVGNNRGPWVNKYFRLSKDASTTINRGAFCSAFVTWVLNEAYGHRACWGAIRTVRDHMTRVDIASIKEGDCVAYRSLTRPWPSGHIGLIVVIDNDEVWSVESNVDLKPKVAGTAARLLTKDLIRSDGNKPYVIGRPYKGRSK